VERATGIEPATFSLGLSLARPPLLAAAAASRLDHLKHDNEMVMG
jgi:hypothetical protein